ncbi:MAG: hypothetical protein KatS3mg118_2911 [Paracoccaceae bacterium]|nr:MAG: hypothetical protein KatS3mg118_2911 [Paracoccaceae bacterium]
MSDQDFIDWQNVAFQTQAHLLANGQRLPEETRLFLAALRDFAERRAEDGRAAWIAAGKQGPRAPEEATPAPGRVLRGLCRLMGPGLAAALAIMPTAPSDGMALEPPTGAPVLGAPAPATGPVPALALSCMLTAALPCAEKAALLGPPPAGPSAWVPWAVLARHVPAGPPREDRAAEVPPLH